VPGHHDGFAGHVHRLQGTVRPALVEVCQAVGNALVPQRHALRFYGLTVDQRVRDGGGQMPVAHAQVKAEGERIGLGAVQALSLRADIGVALLELDRHAFDQGISEGSLDFRLQAFGGHARFDCQRTVGVAADVCAAGADQDAGQPDKQEQGDEFELVLHDEPPNI